MKYPLPNQPPYKVQHYLGKTVGQMLQDPTALSFFQTGLTSSQLVLTSPTASYPPGGTPFIVLNNNDGTQLATLLAYNNGGAGESYILSSNGGRNLTGRNNIVMGGGAMFNATTAQDSIVIGAGAGVDIITGQKNVVIGGDSLNSGTVGNVGSFNTVIGSNNFDNPASSMLSANTILGAFNEGSTGGLGNNNIMIGCSNFMGSVGNTITNSTLIGQNIVNATLSNVILLGSDQNVLIKVGTAGTMVDSGNALQVGGKLNTAGAAPLTAGFGAWDFGKVKVATSTLSTTHYLEVSVDGVLYKVCIN